MLSRRLSLHRRRKFEGQGPGTSDWYLRARGIGAKVTLDSAGFAMFTQSHTGVGSSQYARGYAASDEAALVVGRPGNGAVADIHAFADKQVFPLTPSRSTAIPILPSGAASVVLRDAIYMVVGRSLRRYSWAGVRGTDILLDPVFSSSDLSKGYYSNGGRHMFFLRPDGPRIVDQSGPQGYFDVYPGTSAISYFGLAGDTIFDPVFAARIAGNGTVDYIALPDDERLKPYIPPGAESAPIWSREISHDVVGACMHRDVLHLAVEIRYQEIRRGADGDPVGSVTRARMSLVKGTVLALITVGADGVPVVSNIVSRDVYVGPWGDYPIIEHPTYFELHLNEYSNGVSATDFPLVTCSAHPQRFVTPYLAPLMLRRFGEFAVFPSTIASGGMSVNRIVRVRVGQDGSSNVSLIGDLPSGTVNTFLPLDNHGLIALTLVDGGVTRIFQSQDFGDVWTELPVNSGDGSFSPYFLVNETVEWMPL